MNSTPKMGRRQFLRIVGVSGLAGLALKAGLDLRGVTETVSETRLLMGTVVNLTLVTDDAATGREALAACLDRMAGLEAVMSRHQTDSQLARLNRDGQLAAPDPALVDLLDEALRLSALTGGAFDVTVKPLVDLYQAHQQAGNLPTPDAIRATLDRVGYAHLRVAADAIHFARPGMALTLDGIAKGYIVDQGVAALRARGFENVLVEAGGDLSATGRKAADSPWKIGVEAPRPGGEGLLNVFNVSNQAVATSGDYMQPYSADYREHHILDPRTGHSAPELASATVLAPRGLLADALATALMVLGPEQGLDVLAALPGCAAYLVAKDLRTWRSPGFPAA